MVASLDSLTYYQWGKETTPGTSVAATSKILVPRINFAPVGNPYRPQYAKGIVLRNRGNEIDVGGHVAFSVPAFPVNYEQLPNWLSMGIVNTTAPTGSGPYVYTYTRNPLARPTVKTWTIERRVNDGTTQYDLEFSYCVITKIKLTAAANSPLMVEFEGFCRPPAVAAITSSLVLPTTAEQIVFADTKGYINSTWATLGNTILSGILVGWTVEINTGWYPFYPADARTDKSFTREELNANNVTIAAQLRILAEMSGQWQTERTAAAAQTLRAVRLQAVGSSSRDLKVDFLAKHANRDIYTPESADDRNEITLDFVESTDDTNAFSIVVTNNISSMI